MIMMQYDVSILTAFALYLLVMLAIGVYYSRSQQRLSDYILGGRSLGPWITSMSAEASDMSGWMLMGVPGFAYSTGISAAWIAIGIAIGTYLNWQFVSQRLRNYTEVANNSLTMPDYLKTASTMTKISSASSLPSLSSYSSLYTRRPVSSPAANSLNRSSAWTTSRPSCSAPASSSSTPSWAASWPSAGPTSSRAA